MASVLLLADAVLARPVLAVARPRGSQPTRIGIRIAMRSWTTSPAMHLGWTRTSDTNDESRRWPRQRTDSRRGATGFEVRAHRVIVASRSFDAPYTPPIPGIDAFGGRVLHVAQYRSPGEFAGARVSIVGAGNSAVQIAAELATVARVDMHSRRPIRWQRQCILGKDLHWWLVRTGFDRAGVLDSLVPVTTPVLDDGRYRAALRRAAVGWNPMPVRASKADDS
ncbi:NAD(P)-binding domain-containing protein [Propionimicrobium sp. PCR01-08-3]|uniref:NAD(P)-binding domain-containing protein n=1 Tax=Propionimicrobium sp. PCR01-08-3 TaxID=3052086 RepID=UPI00333FD093